MRVAEYKITTEGFEGYIKVALLKHRERLKLMRECNFSLEQKGKKIEAGNITSNIEAIEKLQDKVPEYIKEVKIKHTKSGKQYVTWDDCEIDPLFFDVVNEVGFALLNGVSLGEA